MQYGASSFHSFNSVPQSRPNPNPYTYANHSFTPHATLFHAQPPAYSAQNRPAAPQNRYIPGATLKTINDHRILNAQTQLKPGTVVEVTRPGHQTELQYATYSGHLAPLTQSTLNRVPNEIRDQVKRVGGPSYFAHDLHNKFATQGFMSQFRAQDFHGPNRPFI